MTDLTVVQHCIEMLLHLYVIISQIAELKRKGLCLVKVFFSLKIVSS